MRDGVELECSLGTHKSMKSAYEEKNVIPKPKRVQISKKNGNYDPRRKNL